MSRASGKVGTDMGIVTDISVSLNGYSAGPNQSLDLPGVA